MIKHILPRWPVAASTAPLLLSQSSSHHPGHSVEPVTGRSPSPSRQPPNLQENVRGSGPETCNTEVEDTALQEMVTAPLPPPVEGWVENLVFPFVFVLPLAPQPVVPKLGIQFTSVLASDAPVLQVKIEVQLAKVALELVPPAEKKTLTVLQPLIHCTQERRCVTANLGPALEGQAYQYKVLPFGLALSLRVFINRYM